MNELKLGAVDAKFADIVWSNEPLSTAELIKKCESQLNWKRTTTYSVLKKFCSNGIFKLENSVVIAKLYCSFHKKEKTHKGRN